MDESSDATLRRRLYQRISEAILEGALPLGERVPSTRLIAIELGISRNTVAESFAQLIADGFLVSRRGSGTFVASSAPRRPLRARETLWDRASRRGRLLAARTGVDDLQGYPAMPFQPGLPSYESFPFETWARIGSRIMRRPHADLLGYGRSAGYGPLQHAVANELRSRRGIVCREEQIIIVGGTVQALDLVCRLILDPEDEVWLEDPSSLYVRNALIAAGAKVVPVAVDEQGLAVAQGTATAANARLAHVTSAHQWPTRVEMSLERRRQLLDWAALHDAWIVEDEYDGVFRYAGSSLPTLHSLDRSDRVILVGSFSLTTFPSIRLGYLVSPPSLVDPFTAAKAVTDRQSSLFEQAILAEFMFEGHYAWYQRRMQAIYNDRQQRLVDRIRDMTGIAIPKADAGLHVVLPLPSGADDVGLSRAARSAGVVAPALSPLYLKTPATAGLMLGFAAGSNREMNAAIETLGARVLPGRRSRSTARLSHDMPG